MSRRRWFDWHSWTGITAGLLLFVVCWTGTFATLSREIDWLLDPAQRVQPAAQRASFGQIADAAQRAHPQATVSWISAPLYARSAAEVVMDAPGGGSLRVWVDPYRARVQGTTTYFNVQRFFRSLHMSLFDWGGSGAGYYVVCALSLLLLVSLVTSLVFYKRWWRGFATLKTGRGLRVLLSDAHKLAGVWSLWFVVVIAVTGGWYLFEMARWQIDPEGSQGQFTVPAPPDLAAAPARMDIDTLVARVRALRPTLEVRNISVGEDGAFQADGQDTHLLVRDRANVVHLDGRTGALLRDQHAHDLDAYWRWSDTADPLHFGDFGGLPTKLVWCVFGLLMTGLCLTGAYLHYQRIVARGGDRQALSRHARRIALGVTCLLLAATAAGGWAEISGYAIDGDASRVWTMTPASVWVFLAAWLAVTLAVIAVWVRKLR